MIASRIRAMSGGHWIALFSAIVLAWLALFLLAVPSDLRDAARVYGGSFWTDLCRVTLDGFGFLRLTAMWILMSGAMMAPTALPAFATYDELPERHENGFQKLVAGYLTIWIGFSVLAAALQMGLVALELVSPFGDSRSAALSAVLLTGAGLYQFSALKQACLSACRAPLMVFLQHWAHGPFAIGVWMGLACLGCCWALMLLAFVGGTMNLAFMGGAMVLMFIEKRPEIGKLVSRPLGAALLALAVVTAWSAI